jgi:hypothetical protein
MKKILGVAIACLAFATVIPSTASAASRHQQERFMENYCSRHDDSDCRSWRRDRGSWNEDRYHGWYNRHRHEDGFDDAAAALFGFAAGTAAGLLTGTVGAATDEPDCVNYRSYDPADDTYLGRDGYRHRCH